MNRVAVAAALLAPLAVAACGNPTPCLDHTGARQPAMYCADHTPGYEWAHDTSSRRPTSKTPPPAKAPAKAPTAGRRR